MYTNTLNNELLRSAVWNFVWGASGDPQALHKRILELLADGAELPPKTHPYWKGALREHLGEEYALAYDKILNQKQDQQKGR